MSDARIEVLEGGRLAWEELAALVIALTPLRAEEARQEPPRSGWRRAALLEGVGRTRYASAPELRGAFRA